MAVQLPPHLALDSLWRRQPSEVGHTTPQAAGATLRELRKTVAGILASRAERCQAAASAVAAGAVQPFDGLAVTDDLDRAGTEPVALMLRAYSLASSGNADSVLLPIELVRVAKSILGAHYEDTVTAGMAVEWKSGISRGEWGRRFACGDVLAVHRGQVVVGNVTVWDAGVGSSGSDVLILARADVRARRPDFD